MYYMCCLCVTDFTLNSVFAAPVEIGPAEKCNEVQKRRLIEHYSYKKASLENWIFSLDPSPVAYKSWGVMQQHVFQTRVNCAVLINWSRLVELWHGRHQRYRLCCRRVEETSAEVFVWHFEHLLQVTEQTEKTRLTQSRRWCLFTYVVDKPVM